MDWRRSGMYKYINICIMCGQDTHVRPLMQNQIVHSHVSMFSFLFFPLLHTQVSRYSLVSVLGPWCDKKWREDEVTILNPLDASLTILLLLQCVRWTCKRIISPLQTSLFTPDARFTEHYPFNRDSTWLMFSLMLPVAAPWLLSGSISQRFLQLLPLLYGIGFMKDKQMIQTNPKGRKKSEEMWSYNISILQTEKQKKLLVNYLSEDQFCSLSL